MTSAVHLVLGGSGGIGSALTRQLIQRGDRVVAFARDTERLRALADETGAAIAAGDARDGRRVSQVVDDTIEEFGRLDGAACLVGSILLKPAHATSPEELDEVVGQNLVTAFNLIRAAAPTMAKSGGGSIVLMSSAAARHGLPNHEAIGAAKAAVEGLARSAAASYAPRGLRVNAVAPGLVRTPLSGRITGSAASLAASERMHALGRVGEPDEVASLLAWLLSRHATWVTGQVLGIDGGLSSVMPRP